MQYLLLITIIVFYEIATLRSVDSTFIGRTISTHIFACTALYLLIHYKHRDNLCLFYFLFAHKWQRQQKYWLKHHLHSEIYTPSTAAISRLILFSRRSHVQMSLPNGWTESKCRQKRKSNNYSVHGLCCSLKRKYDWDIRNTNALDNICVFTVELTQFNECHHR